MNYCICNTSVVILELNVKATKLLTTNVATGDSVSSLNTSNVSLNRFTLYFLHKLTLSFNHKLT